MCEVVKLVIKMRCFRGADHEFRTIFIACAEEGKSDFEEDIHVCLC